VGSGEGAASLDPQEGEAAMVMDSAGREVVSASAMVVGAGLEDVGASAAVPVVRVAMAEHQAMAAVLEDQEAMAAREAVTGTAAVEV